MTTTFPIPSERVQSRSSTFATTTDIYSHVMPALAREAADRMAKTLWT